MRKIIFLILALQVSTISSQEIHSPTEILKILEKSKVSYELSILTDEIQPLDRSNNLNYHNYYRIIKDNQILTQEFKLNDTGEAFSKKAEEYFNSGQPGLAREMYQNMLQENPEYYKVMTYIGQTYGIEKDYDNAIKWYQKSIDKNYIDYMAHWFLADTYITKNKPKEALKEITIAMILNRNNPRIRKSFEEIYSKNKLKTPSWVFTPQVRIDSVGENKVKIEFNEDWLGYALVKALWAFEPNYRESMGGQKGVFSTTEELEAIANLANAFDKKKLKRYPEFKALQNAIDNEMVNEFIFYEIVLPRFPNVVYQLPKDFIENISSYVITIRGKK